VFVSSRNRQVTAEPAVCVGVVGGKLDHLAEQDDPFLIPPVLGKNRAETVRRLPAGCVDFQAGATFGLCLFPVTRLRQRMDELRADGGDFGGYLERPAVRGDGLLSLVGCEQGYAEPLQRTGVVRSQRHGDAVVASRLREPAVFVQRVAQLAMSPEVP